MAFKEQLFGCTNDMFSCLGTFIVKCGPCFVNALATHQITNQGFAKSFFITWLCCFGMSQNRQDIKRKLQIRETYWQDCLIYFFCMSCATAQDYREVENRFLADP